MTTASTRLLTLLAASVCAACGGGGSDSPAPATVADAVSPARPATLMRPDDPTIVVNPTPVTVNPTPVTVNPTPVTVTPSPAASVTVNASPVAQAAASANSHANSAAGAAAGVVVPPNAPPAFGAGVFSAPPDQQKISATVRLEVVGSGIQNVELLPGAGYIPKYGIFIVSQDHTHAVLDWDTTKWPNGPVRVRISAFDKPGSDPNASEIVAMQARTWVIANPVEAPNKPLGTPSGTIPAIPAIPAEK